MMSEFPPTLRAALMLLLVLRPVRLHQLGEEGRQVLLLLLLLVLLLVQLLLLQAAARAGHPVQVHDVCRGERLELQVVKHGLVSSESRLLFRGWRRGASAPFKLGGDKIKTKTKKRGDDGIPENSGLSLVRRC